MDKNVLEVRLRFQDEKLLPPEKLDISLKMELSVEDYFDQMTLREIVWQKIMELDLRAYRNYISEVVLRWQDTHKEYTHKIFTMEPGYNNFEKTRNRLASQSNPYFWPDVNEL